jgi:hypothetical protein
VARKKAGEGGGGRRITVALDGPRLAILEEAKPEDGSLSDAMRALIDLACKADQVERQNRELSAALVTAMGEMAATLVEIRRQVARLEQARG